MDEENFEKKKSSKKKVSLIVVLIVALLAIAALVTWFVVNKINSKPEKVFGKAVEEMFEGAEKEVEHKTAKVDLEISGKIKTTGNVDSEITTQASMINAILQSATLNLQASVDTENKIADYTVSAKYMGQDIVSLEGLIQDNKMYFYLKDLYSKYIEVPTEELEGIDLASIFETATVDPQLTKDIKTIFKEKVENSEIESEEAEIEVKGKDKKVNKATLTLSFEELVEISEDILKKVEEYTTDKDVKEMISEMLEELDYARTEDVIETVIELYTEKAGNKIVGFDISLVGQNDDGLMLFKGRMPEKDTWEIEFAMSPKSTKASDAETLLKFTVKEENENEGQISMTMNIPEENMEVTLNVAYKVEYDVAVEKKNVNNSIKADDLTDADAQEIMENAKKNEILNSILTPMIENSTSNYNSGYNNDYDYDYDF